MVKNDLYSERSNEYIDYTIMVLFDINMFWVWIQDYIHFVPADRFCVRF